MPILKVIGLRKSYSRRRVVDGVDFEVHRGEIVGLLGPNGAGKTTCFRMTCGMVEPERGRVMINDKDVTRWPMYRRAAEGGMGYLAQESSVFRKLTVEQNLTAMMEMIGMRRKERRLRCEELLEQFNIQHIRRSRAGNLSGGERRRLEIARCLVSDPQIILLDEPFAGIDPVTISDIQGIVRELRELGISILITDHQVRETLAITDRSYVIRAGKVLCHGTPGQVTNNADARKYYFGENIQFEHAAGIDRESHYDSEFHGQSSVDPAHEDPLMPHLPASMERAEQAVRPVAQGRQVGHDDLDGLASQGE